MTAPDQPILLLGATGMLGRAFTHLLSAGARTTASIASPPRARCDLASTQSVREYLREHPLAPGTIILNCAAWTDVDGAETHEVQATQINAHALAPLLEASQHTGSVLVNFGTDYVFAGDATCPYAADAPLAPLNAYGRSKAAGERLLRTAPPAHWLHIRTSWLYAPWGKNFVRTMSALVRTKPSVKVVSDQRGRPTSAENLAAGTLALLRAGARGVHHLTDATPTDDGISWHDFASAIRDDLAAPALVHPCTSAEFPRPAKRPAYSVLDLATTQRLIGPLPDWRTALRAVLPRLEP